MVADRSEALAASSGKDPVREFFRLRCEKNVHILQLHSDDGTNRLTRDGIVALSKQIATLAVAKKPLILTGNERFFSAGADLQEISKLHAASAYQLSRLGQGLMNAIQSFPAPVFAAISGFCLGGGLDLALACRHRIAAPNAVFGHRGAALGLVTGWGGTQRLPRLIGKAVALELLAAAERLSAETALNLGLVEAVREDPIGEAVRRST